MGILLQMILKVLLITTVQHSDALLGFFSFSSAIDILIDVRNHLHTGCVYLLHHSSTQTELSDFYQVTKIGINLSTKGIPVSILDIQNIKKKQKCLRNLPIMVILSSTGQMQIALQKTIFLYIFKHSSQKILRSSTWLLYLSTWSIEDYFKDVDIPFDCLFLVAEEHGNNSVRITEVYRIYPSLPLSFNTFCTWKNGEGLSCSKYSMMMRRNTLQGLDMKIIVPNTTAVQDEGSKHLKEFFYTIWHDIAGNINLNSLSTKRNDQTQGQNINGTWTGLIGDVTNGLAHLGVDPVGMKGPRTEVVDFTVPLFTFKISMFLKEPDSALSWGRFLAPFGADLWLAVIASMLVLTLCLSLFHLIGRYTGNEEANGPNTYSLYNSSLYVFGIFCQQGHEISPRSWSCRIIYWMTYLTAIILLASYSGTLVSFLAVKHHPLPFNDIEGFLRDETYKTGMIRSYFQLFTKTKDIPISLQTPSQKLIRKVEKEKDNSPLLALDGLKRLCKDKYALLITASVVPPLMDDVPCGVVSLPRFSIEIGMSYIIAKGSPYRSIINWKINALRAGGILKRGFTDVDTTKFSKSHDGFMKVGMGEVVPILIMLGLGACLGCLILLAELYLHRWMRRRRIRYVEYDDSMC
ncbi:Ionotropic receptor 141 [Blattella germanica]|nr:Ionotropic receptor 141 [Blattella germanica]